MSGVSKDITNYAEGECQQKKRIDITIKGDDWCIIIENKLYHHLSNPLKAYWEHVKGYSKKEHIIGIVLSLDAKSEKECTEEDITFINVTHEELIYKVQSILKLSNIDDDTDIFYLREYIRTIKTHYWNKMDTPQMNVLVQALIDQGKAIEKIETSKNRAIEFIERQTQEVFASRGYKKVRQWFCHPKNENLCFYVAPTHEILESNKLGLAFEVYNELKKDLGDDILKIKNTLQSKNLGNNFHFDKARDTGNMSRLVTYRKPDILSIGTDIKSELEKILDTYFFNENGIEDTTIQLFPQSMALKRAKDYQE